MQFPEARVQSVEDEFVHYWGMVDDVDGLLHVICEAVRRKRPQLAIRLLGLLDEDLDVTLSSEVEALRRRARLFLVDSTVQASDDWDALANMTGELRTMIMDRSRQRTRRSLRPDSGDMLGLFRGTPRRRR